MSRNPTRRDIRRAPQYEVLMRPGAHGKKEYYLTPELEEVFRSLYPTHLDKEMMELFGLCKRTVHRFGHSLGLQKDREVISAKRVENMKRTCVERGVYARKRNQGMPPQCIEAARRRMKSDQNPLRRMKEDDPERFHAMYRRISADRKALFRSERRRADLSLERRTRLNLPQFNYTPSQAKHRSSALQRGYILGDFRESMGERYTIYWNRDTERTAMFERNLERDGFTLRELPAPRRQRQRRRSDDED